MRTLLKIGFLVLPLLSHGQNCINLSPDESDLCWVKAFLLSSPIHDQFDDRFINYEFGVNEYYPTGKDTPWGGYYMPLISGGIATRWQSGNDEHIDTSTLLSWENVKNLSIDDIALLSPSEKMDIYMGNREFSITRNELIRRGPLRENVESWEGFCNGIRLAGALLPEPQRKIIVKSKSGEEIYITFFPADLKALGGAIYYYTEFYASLGENNKRKPNAGYFDILLRQILGKQKRTFFIDIEKSDEKWNESIVGFERELINKRQRNPTDNVPANTKEIIEMRVTLYLLGELSFDQANSLTVPLIENKDLVTPYVLNYELHVDQDKNIIGGKWIKNEHREELNFLDYPDYIWFGSGKGTDDVIDNSRYDNNVLLPFFEVQHLFYIAIK